MRFIPCTLLVILMFLTGISAIAQEKKKDEKKVTPAIKVILPLGAAPGKTTKLTIRGTKLEAASEVKIPGDKGKAKIVSKGAAGVPDKNPDKVGDTQVVVEVTLNDKLPGEPILLSVVTPDGETKPHALLVEPAIAEKEPNEGFKQFHELKLPSVIEGAIGQPRDVDVFRFDGKSGQKVVAEVFAGRHGSALDAQFTIYDAKGRQLAVNDDFSPEHRDAKIEIVLPADGDYFLVLMDANDGGGPVHVYRLVVK